MPSRSRFVCLVCGFPALTIAPYSDDGIASFDICPCCGVEFGYDDATRTHADLRARWVAGGMKWWSQSSMAPAAWDPTAQVAGLRMSRCHDALERFRLAPDAGPANGPFRLVSSVSGPATPGEVAAAWGDRSVADEVTDLWSATRTARLFEDTDSGQWGLVLLDPQASRHRTDAERAARPQDVRPDDMVIGEFLGDQELLVFAPSEGGLRRVLVALPVDARSEWFGIGGDLAQFLVAYFDARGDKYWEARGA